MFESFYVLLLIAGSISINNKIYCIVEAKSPNIDIADTKYLEQAYSYAIHPDVRAKYYVLCNGRKITVFDINKIESIYSSSLEKLKLKKEWDALYNLISVQAFTKPKTLNFKPDYGLAMKKNGINKNISISFYKIPIFHISRINDLTFTFMNEIEKEHITYAISFDIPAEIFLKIINSLHKEIAIKIMNKLTKQPYSTDIEPPIYISCEARLGDLETNGNEEYVPLQIIDAVL
jgi:hypothetical protein